MLQRDFRDSCAGCDGGQEGECAHGEGDVPMPGGPVPHLVVVETDLAFDDVEALFETPAGAGHADQFRQRIRADGGAAGR